MLLNTPIKIIRLFLLYFAISLLLAGCDTLSFHRQVLNQQLTWQQRQKQLSTLTRWTIRGAMSIHANKQAFSVYYNWQQTNESQYVIHLFGPLGIGAVTITGKKNKVTLTNAHGQTFRSKTPEKLIENALGFHLPISSLFYWVRGLPVPNAPSHIKKDEFNHITTLKQSGWKIQYIQYAGICPHDLPSKIILQSKNVYTKITISRWILR